MTAGLDYTNIGTKAVKESQRPKFEAAIKRAEWVTPEGQHPMSPALGLQQVIGEFGIRPVTALSYNAILFDRYQVLGVRTRKQALWFLDKGTSVVPIAVETLPEPVEYLAAS